MGSLHRACSVSSSFLPLRYLPPAVRMLCFSGAGSPSYPNPHPQNKKACHALVLLVTGWISLPKAETHLVFSIPFYLTEKRYQGNILVSICPLFCLISHLDLNPKIRIGEKNATYGNFSGAWKVFVKSQPLAQHEALDMFIYLIPQLPPGVYSIFPFPIRGNWCSERLETCQRSHNEWVTDVTLTSMSKHYTLHQTLSLGATKTLLRDWGSNLICI